MYPFRPFPQFKMQKLFTVTIRKPVFGGSCISAIDGKTVFVPYALPEEVVEIAIVKEHKNYSEGKIERILKASPYRTEPACPYFYRCGGCDMQMAKADYQRKLRAETATEAFCRAGCHEECSFEFIAGDEWEYRSRFQFHTTEKGGFAQKRQGSAELVPIRDCPVAVKPLRALLQKGEAAAADMFSGAAKTYRRLHVFASDSGIFTELNAASCSVRLCGKTVRFNPLGFFQSNMTMTEKLIRTMMAEADFGGRILDFYAGVGTLSLFAADCAAEIHLVEHNKHALEYARLNFGTEDGVLNGRLKVEYYGLDGKNWAKTAGAHRPFDTVIADPPRSGMEKAVLKWFCAAKIPQLVYVSCDPVSFARDAAVLIAAGYRLKKRFLFDFYPQTHHIETLGIFRL